MVSDGTVECTVADIHVSATEQPVTELRHQPSVTEHRHQASVTVHKKHASTDHRRQNVDAPDADAAVFVKPLAVGTVKSVTKLEDDIGTDAKTLMHGTNVSDTMHHTTALGTDAESIDTDADAHASIVGTPMHRRHPSTLDTDAAASTDIDAHASIVERHHASKRGTNGSVHASTVGADANPSGTQTSTLGTDVAFTRAHTSNAGTIPASPQPTKRELELAAQLKLLQDRLAENSVHIDSDSDESKHNYQHGKGAESMARRRSRSASLDLQSKIRETTLHQAGTSERSERVLPYRAMNLIPLHYTGEGEHQFTDEEDSDSPPPPNQEEPSYRLPSLYGAERGAALSARPYLLEGGGGGTNEECMRPKAAVAQGIALL